jgi:hypothetical protein
MDEISVGTREDRRKMWQETLKHLRESGQKKSVFCREQGIPAWKLAYWQRRLEVPADGLAEESGFAQVLPEQRSSSGLVLFLANGLRLELGTSFDELTLARFLSVAARPC